MSRRKPKGWRGQPKRHAAAVRKGLRRKGHGYIDYSPGRSKLAWARDRATRAKNERR